LIEIRNLSLSFDGKAVLKDISLDIMDNEILVILGPSGQGKTVLIKSLVGLIQPDAGSIKYDGIDIIGLSKKNFRKIQNRTAFVFQDSALLDFLDVRENLGLYLKMHSRLKENEILNEVLKAIHFVGLEKSVLDKYPEELSGGMMKRVAIARAIIKDPCFFFYDEPTVGLDAVNVEKVVDLIMRLKRHICTTAIIVTHDIQFMHEVAERVALLNNGRLEFIGKAGELSDETLHQFYSAGEKNDHE
jgi:phospholipid/cholesterol/gamma-HCH transport system ATP-binding protein